MSQVVYACDRDMVYALSVVASDKLACIALVCKASLLFKHFSLKQHDTSNSSMFSFISPL
jgi:hypothetical protein